MTDGPILISLNQSTKTPLTASNEQTLARPPAGIADIHARTAGKNVACVQLQWAKTFKFWPAKAAPAQHMFVFVAEQEALQ
jgi:hypothetical protein